MEAKAIARHVRVTPRKARRMVDLIRGKKATEATTILKFAPQDASLPVRKVLESAIANARVKADIAFRLFLMSLQIEKKLEEELPISSGNSLWHFIINSNAVPIGIVDN